MAIVYADPDYEEQACMLEDAMYSVEGAMDALRHKSRIYDEYIDILTDLLWRMQQDFNEADKAVYEARKAEEDALRAASYRW